MAGIYPSVPEPGVNPATQLATLRALKSAVELLVANTTGLKTASGVGANAQVFALAEEVNTLIKREQTLRAAGDTTSQDNLDAVEAAINAEVQSLNADVAQAFSELAQITETILEIRSDVNANSAAITVEAGARSTADTALAGQITTLTATVNTNNSNLQSSIQNEAVARADADSSLASQINTVSTKADNNAAAITTEASTRSNADTSIANSVTTLATSVVDGTNYNGQQTSIQVQATAISSLNTITATRYTVTLDTNGYVSGFSLLNAGTGIGSQFKILADRFIIAYPGMADKQVFSVQNIGGTNTLTFDGSIIASGSITSLGVVTAGYLSDTANIANAKFLIDLAAKSIIISD
jgi:hypothetical protein